MYYQCNIEHTTTRYPAQRSGTAVEHLFPAARWTPPPDLALDGDSRTGPYRGARGAGNRASGAASHVAFLGQGDADRVGQRRRLAVIPALIRQASSLALLTLVKTGPLRARVSRQSCRCQAATETPSAARGCPALDVVPRLPAVGAEGRLPCAAAAVACSRVPPWDADGRTAAGPSPACLRCYRYRRRSHPSLCLYIHRIEL